eukprot:CAMPEP_0176240760 /NCGR_PEP_ID=MMETSP0121_2-20121125/29542_1 /TAXON_ID=160619 /ORGANISM="Kryptoperidinium foliaceum, Strain CCMP 1326" /LENGTH=64 /DNA_ID=CAMNT_0017580267 /DNA_START=40 /DNA_END=234 /DNA_ORIENTATION=+
MNVTSWGLLLAAASAKIPSIVLIPVPSILSFVSNQYADGTPRIDSNVSLTAPSAVPMDLFNDSE